MAYSTEKLNELYEKVAKKRKAELELEELVVREEE